MCAVHTWILSIQNIFCVCATFSEQILNAICHIQLPLIIAIVSIISVSVDYALPPPQFVSISVDYEHHNLIKITIDIAPRTSKHTKQITFIESHIGHMLTIAIPPLVEVHMASRHKARFTWHQGRSHSTRHTSARQRAPRLRSARLIWPIAIGGWMTPAQPPALRYSAFFAQP